MKNDINNLYSFSSFNKEQQEFDAQLKYNDFRRKISERPRRKKKRKR